MISISYIHSWYERATLQLRNARQYMREDSHLIMNLIAEHVLLLCTLSTGVSFTALGLVVGFDLGLFHALICAFLFYVAGTIVTFKTVKRADGFLFQLRLQDIPKESWDAKKVAEVMSGMILRSYEIKVRDDSHDTASSIDAKHSINQLWKKAGRSVQEECCICCEEYGRIDTLHFAPRCGHAFHGNCIKKWITVSMANKLNNLSEEQQKKVFPTCPLCNESLIRNTKVG
mmetsp:Transcript_1620/g.2383  ORF Transcript_1620/g.2383 Transcript_1620/m.2383 type:complete len:230 (-) Transcript_1620:355-1044(-)